MFKVPTKKTPLGPNGKKVLSKSRGNTIITSHNTGWEFSKRGITGEKGKSVKRNGKVLYTYTLTDHGKKVRTELKSK